MGLAYRSGMTRTPITDEQDFIDALAGLGYKSEDALADAFAAWNLSSVRTQRAQEFAPFDELAMDEDPSVIYTTGERLVVIAGSLYAFPLSALPLRWLPRG